MLLNPSPQEGSNATTEAWPLLSSDLCVCVLCVRPLANGRLRAVSSPVMEEEALPTASTDMKGAAHTHRCAQVHTRTHTLVERLYSHHSRQLLLPVCDVTEKEEEDQRAQPE